MKSKLLFIIFTFILTINLFGQNSDNSQNNTLEKKERKEIAKLDKERSEINETAETEAKKKELKNIKYRFLQDNGFLVDEAFSQEENSLQHGIKFRRALNGDDWEVFVEEEIPLKGDKHQLSIGFQTRSFNSEEIGKVKGFGDLELSYRYQLIGGEYSRISIAPSFSAILPTGSYKKELGSGSFGVEFSIPVSIAINSRFMSHSNLGVRLTPNSKNILGEKAFTKDIEAGQSFVWLAHPKFNPLIEFVWERNQEVIGNRITEREHEIFVNPGFRWGHTFKNGLMVVPGVSFPIGVGSSRGENGFLFYLSFEHPFRKKEEQ